MKIKNSSYIVPIFKKKINKKLNVNPSSSKNLKAKNRRHWI